MTTVAGCNWQDAFSTVFTILYSPYGFHSNNSIGAILEIEIFLRTTSSSDRGGLKKKIASIIEQMNLLLFRRPPPILKDIFFSAGIT